MRASALEVNRDDIKAGIQFSDIRGWLLIMSFTWNFFGVVVIM